MISLHALTCSLHNIKMNLRFKGRDNMPGFQIRPSDQKISHVKA